MKKKYITPEICTYHISPSSLLVVSISEGKVAKPQSSLIEYVGDDDEGGSLSNTKTDSFD